MLGAHLLAKASQAPRRMGPGGPGTTVWAAPGGSQGEAPFSLGPLVYQGFIVWVPKTAWSPKQCPSKLEKKEALLSWATAGVRIGWPPASCPEFLEGGSEPGRPRVPWTPSLELSLTALSKKSLRTFCRVKRPGWAKWARPPSGRGWWERLLRRRRGAFGSRPEPMGLSRGASPWLWALGLPYPTAQPRARGQGDGRELASLPHVCAPPELQASLQGLGTDTRSGSERNCLHRSLVQTLPTRARQPL